MEVKACSSVSLCWNPKWWWWWRSSLLLTGCGRSSDALHGPHWHRSDMASSLLHDGRSPDSPLDLWHHFIREGRRVSLLPGRGRSPNSQVPQVVSTETMVTEEEEELVTRSQDESSSPLFGFIWYHPSWGWSWKLLTWPVLACVAWDHSFSVVFGWSVNLLLSKGILSS